MSRSIIKKALVAIEEEEERESTKKDHPNRSDRSLTQKKHHKKLKSNFKLKSSVKDLKMKCVLDEFKSKRSGDMTEDNLSFLRKISGVKTASTEVVNQVINHQAGRLAKKAPPKKAEEKSAFTEEDFAKFEKEYFVKW